MIVSGKNQQLEPHIQAHLEFILKNIEEGTLNIKNYNHL